MEVISNKAILCHERLEIYGLLNGKQPIVNSKKDLFLTANGEIYNHFELRKKALREIEIKEAKNNINVFQTDSDCEVIMNVYKYLGIESLNLLRGIYSFVLYDKELDEFVIGRDPLGVTTLYYGYQKESPRMIFVASELKALHEFCDVIHNFPPGHVYHSKTESFKRIYAKNWGHEIQPVFNGIDCESSLLDGIRTKLEDSVRKRLMCQVPFGVLLSGGLDSSLIASIAARELKKSNPAFVLNSFSVGLTEDSPDLKAAQEVAQFLGLKHHSFQFTIEEAINAINDVIYHLETYDVTTVRASVPMYLLSRKIKAMGIKMVLSGEGSDELFGGYLYFNKAPNKEQLHKELVERVQNLHLADCLRANKSTMAFGLEARVPFLDIDFVDYVMNIDASNKLITKTKMEKHLLRKAFDYNYLPQHVLWRQKEQFSDGVGYSWIDSIKQKSAQIITDDYFNERKFKYKAYDMPDTKEALWYRDVFDSYFGDKCVRTVKRWIPRSDWGCAKDPSGRAQLMHSAAYDIN